MPEPQAIIGPAMQKVLQECQYDQEKIKESFDVLIHKMESNIHALYLEKQREYGKQVLALLVDEMCSQGNFRVDQARENLGNYFDDLDAFFLSLAQSRKSRAGDAFEGIIHMLFKSLSYPFSFAIQKAV